MFEQVMKIFTPFRLWKVQVVLWFFGVKVSRKRLYELAEKQTKKGIKEHGISIIECNYNAYNWTDMASEEGIDLLVYSLKNKKNI